jgi:sulfur relay (sulfurtransferase) DsrC/TusE family protein
MNKAIVYLLNNNNKDILNFRKSFSLLYNNYYKKFPCDIICFYEQDFPQIELSFLKHQLEKINIVFEPIEFMMPEYKPEVVSNIPEYFPHPDFPESVGFSIGYRHMCNFFAGDIFNNSVILKYKYILRLDTDSFIIEPIQYDIFDKLKENNALYGYINIQDDHPGVIKYLWEYSEKYFKSINKNKIFNKQLIKNHKNKVYYTNFEVCDVEWFSSRDYQNYFKFINDSGGIYQYRWGDHSIRYIALNSLLEPDQMYFYHDIRYFHQKEYYNNHITKSFNVN